MLISLTHLQILQKSDVLLVSLAHLRYECVDKYKYQYMYKYSEEEN